MYRCSLIRDEVGILNNKNTEKTTNWTDAVGFDVGAIVAILLRRKWIISIVCLLVFSFGTLTTMKSPKIYQATATVEIEKSVPTVLGHKVQDVYNLGAQGYYDSRSYYETQYKIISSRPVAVKAAELLGLSPELMQAEVTNALNRTENKQTKNVLELLPAGLRDKLAYFGILEMDNREELLEIAGKLDGVGLLLGKIRVEPIKRSKLVLVHVEDISPERASIIANTVVDAYMAVNLEKKIDATQSAVQWLADQVLQTKQKLEDGEQALYNFKRDSNIVSVSLEDRLSMTSQTLSSLNLSLSQTKAQRIALEAQRATLAARNTNNTESVMGNNLIQRLKESLAQVQQEELELLNRYTGQHPKVQALRKRIELLEKSISSEIKKIGNVLGQKYESLVATERRLKQAINEVKQEALELNKREIEYKRLKREADNNLDLHTLVLKRHKEAKLTQMLKVNNVHSLERALVPTRHIKPRVMRQLILFLILGVILGLAGAIVMEFIDNSVKNQGHVENELGLSFLGILPVIGDEGPGEGSVSSSDRSEGSRSSCHLKA